MITSFELYLIFFMMNANNSIMSILINTYWGAKVAPNAISAITKHVKNHSRRNFYLKIFFIESIKGVPPVPLIFLSKT